MVDDFIDRPSGPQPLSPIKPDAPLAAPDSRLRRPESLWPDSGRGADPGASTSSMGSVFDRIRTRPARGVAAMAFDVCHVGVVLRAVLAVQVAIAVGVAFVAVELEQWLVLFATGAGVGLTGTLLWLMGVCALKPLLALTGDAVQALVAVTLGALSGGAGWALLPLTGLAPDSVVSQGWPAAAAGAVIAAVLFYWLRLRAKLAQPADATARLVELQSRIRPHFLFNTLNTAMALVRVDPRKAEDVLADLAELFRVALIPGGESVSLAEEIDLAQRYLAIEQIRFGDRLAVKWDLDDEAGTARVPPLLLQPLVENAVRHGIEPSGDGGQIRVRTRVRRGHALLSVVNTVPSEPSQPGHGLALRNVRERLHLMHDVAAQFDARREGQLFRVQIVVPL
jgi:two-component system sensor histidine kinase AlgZ